MNHNCRELHRKVGNSSEAVVTTRLSVSFLSSPVCMSQVLQVMASSSHLEQKWNNCLWAQGVFIILVTSLMASWSFTLYVHFSSDYAHWITAENWETNGNQQEFNIKTNDVPICAKTSKCKISRFQYWPKNIGHDFWFLRVQQSENLKPNLVCSSPLRFCFHVTQDKNTAKESRKKILYLLIIFTIMSQTWNMMISHWCHQSLFICSWYKNTAWIIFAPYIRGLH